MKTRTSITIEKGLLTQAKIKADQVDITLSNIVEEALKAYLDPAMGVIRTAQGTAYISGPTVETMKSTFTTFDNVGHVGHDLRVR